MRKPRGIGAVLTCAACAVGCGGQAQQEVERADAGTPPSGFYFVAVKTISNTCQPVQVEDTSDELVGAGPGLVNISISPDHARQDVPLDQPFTFTWSGCATIRLHVTDKTSQSFVVDHQMDWLDPSACPDTALFETRSSHCSSHRVETYELDEACPATRNGVSCSG